MKDDYNVFPDAEDEQLFLDYVIQGDEELLEISSLLENTYLALF